MKISEYQTPAKEKALRSKVVPDCPSAAGRIGGCLENGGEEAEATVSGTTTPATSRSPIVGARGNDADDA